MVSVIISPSLSLRIRLKKLIKESAVYEKRANYRRCCWYVHAEVLARFDQEALPIPCQWTYVTPGAHSAREEAPGVSGAPNTSPTTPQSASNTPSSNKRKSAGSMSITKFMKKCASIEQVGVECIMPYPKIDLRIYRCCECTVSVSVFLVH